MMHTTSSGGDGQVDAVENAERAVALAQSLDLNERRGGRDHFASWLAEEAFRLVGAPADAFASRNGSTVRVDPRA